jgi:hypothetical protein
MSNPKIRLWSAARVAMVALVIALGIGQVISDDAIPAANADTTSGNNGWGNGGDPPNPGSDHGNGVSQGGPGADHAQSDSKTELVPHCNGGRCTVHYVR